MISLEMDLTLFWSFLLSVFISAISTQSPVIEITNANGNQVLENEALSLASSSSDVSNKALNKEDRGKTAELSSSTSNTTPPTVTTVINSSTRRSVRRSKRRSSRRSSRRRRKIKPSARTSESTHTTKQMSHRSKTEGHTVTQTASSKRLKTSETAVKVTTSSPLRSTKISGRKSRRRTTRKNSKITKPSAQETNKSPEMPKQTTRSVTSKRTEHTFFETERGKSGKTIFSTAKTETETVTSSPTPQQNETRIVVKGDSRSDVISLEMSNSPQGVGESHRSSVTKELHQNSSTTNTDNKIKHVTSKTTASNQLPKLINNSKFGTTDASAGIVTNTSARNITSSTSKTLPFYMENNAKTSPMEPVEKTPAGESVLLPTLRQPTQKTITNVSRQGPVPIASVLARVLPYLAGILGSSHVIVKRIRPETIVRGNEGSFIDPTMQQMSRRRHFSIQSIPVQLNFAMQRLLNANRGKSSATFLMRSQMDIYRQRELCSKTPIRLRKMCVDNMECQRKMECYSGRCCATSTDHAEMLDKMLKFMERRRSQRFRMRQ